MIIREITSEAEFVSLMEEIDVEFIAEAMPIPARAFNALLKFGSKTGYAISLTPAERAPVVGCYTGQDATIRIFRWFDERYGDKQKSFAPWLSVCEIRGDFYGMRIPTLIG